MSSTAGTKICLISGGASADGFSAIKMTALGRPQFLVSETVM